MDASIRRDGAASVTPGAWLSVATVCALGAVSPGPSLAVVVRHSMIARAQGLACALAHAVGVGAYALLTVAGLAVAFGRYPVLHVGVAVAGALYLFWLGIAALRAADADRPGAPAGAVSADRFGAARDGFAMALLNPKIAVFFLALFSQFIGPQTGGRDTAILSTTAMVIDGTWYALVATILSGAGAVAWLRRHGRLIDRLSGALLIAVAAWALTQAVAAAA